MTVSTYATTPLYRSEYPQVRRILSLISAHESNASVLTE
uniref:Uncharacterized protein n=1 Tax=Petalonia binghamiae TaxID=698476 RepID=A0A2H4ZR14_9PHAE|nr:hypothetical protein PebiMp26 [Endarachne binghamiae]AUG32993.1 hypothetical protein PebiMp26 [Endarachne binghamiae]